MMWCWRKVVATVVVLWCMGVVLMAQNLQIYYDFGKARRYVTTTFELYKGDRIGYTYFFLDFDFNFNNPTSVGKVCLSECGVSVC